MSVRRSQLQRQVLSLYKQLLRASEGKPGFAEAVRLQFRHQAASVARSDVIRIEYLLRRGRRKLQFIRDPNVTGMASFVEEEAEGRKDDK